MGGVAGAVADGVTSGIAGGSCCTHRRPPVRCWNPQLNCRLVKLEYGGEAFEEVWVFRDSAPLDLCVIPGLDPVAGNSLGHSGSFGATGSSSTASLPLPQAHIPEALEPHFAIVYNYGLCPLKPLRLDWRPDGLGFVEGSLRPKEEVRLKVFHQPLKASKLMGQLQKLEEKVYDPVGFNSKHFCEYLFDMAEGVEEGCSAARTSL
mmetsp:Transcript_144267/g.402083  ORF Transcript_144267/g.402083 Transcript_144267/m.402083 type:complete len:205 (+) Transcript_144267:95-709(+)